MKTSTHLNRTSVKSRIAARRSLAALMLAALACGFSADGARAENELQRLWGDVWSHRTKRTKTPSQPKAAHPPAPNVPAANEPISTQTPAPAADQAKSPPPPPLAPAAPTIPVILPKVQSVSESLETTGNAEAVTQVKLVARVAGYLEQIHFEDGQLVKKGDLLFTIQQDQYRDQLQQAEAQLEAQEVLRDHAHLEVGRYTALLKQHATSEVDVDHWVYEEKTAEANILAAEAQVGLAELNLGYTEVKAPFDGQMGKHLIDVANMVGGGGQPAALAEITQLDPIYVVGNISSQQALQIRENLDQRRLSLDELHQIPVEAALADETGFPHHGTIEYVAPQIDPQTGTLYVRGIMRNPNRTLLPGVFVKIRLPMGKVTQSALLVPQRALQEDQGGRYLFVVGDDDVVEKRYVQLGSLVGDLQVATSGIGRHDRIVVGELWRVTPGTKVVPKPTTLEATQ